MLYRSRDEFPSSQAWKEYIMNDVLELGMLVKARYDYSSLTGRVSVSEGDLGEVLAIQHGKVKITWNGNTSGTLWHQMQDEFFEPAELKVCGGKQPNIPILAEHRAPTIKRRIHLPGIRTTNSQAPTTRTDYVKRAATTAAKQSATKLSSAGDNKNTFIAHPHRFA